jgi:transcriptional regulator with XRE-family HTH domain
MLVGQNIARARLALGWSQDRLAKEAGGATNSDVSRVERGLVDRCAETLHAALAVRVRESLADDGTIDARAAGALAALQADGQHG